MLVVTRKEGESIYIGDDVVITILRLKGEAVRIGIEAPREIQVHREEVYKKIKEQQSYDSVF